MKYLIGFCRTYADFRAIAIAGALFILLLSAAYSHTFDIEFRCSAEHISLERQVEQIEREHAMERINNGEGTDKDYEIQIEAMREGA